MRKLLSILSVMLVIGVILGFQSTSYGLSLRLDDITDANPAIVITDGGLNDANPAAGAVTFIGAVGNFNINVSTGISYPVQGSPALPYLDLNSVNTTSGGAGELYVDVTQIGFTGNFPAFEFRVGGTTQGQVRFAVGVDNGNVPFGSSTFVGYDPTPNPVPATYFGPGAFSDTKEFGPVSVSALYSLTIFTDLVHSGAGTTSFDAELTPIPEPATMLLVGTGLVGLAGYGRRKLSKK